MPRPAMAIGEWGRVSQQEVRPGRWIARARFRDAVKTRKVEAWGASDDEAEARLHTALAERYQQIPPALLRSKAEPQPYVGPAVDSRPVSRQLMLEVLRRDRLSCRGCGALDDLVIGHCVARRRGGPTELWNLVALCPPCNQRQGSGTEWYRMTGSEAV